MASLALREELESLLYTCEDKSGEDVSDVKFVPLQRLYRLLTKERIREVVDGADRMAFENKSRMVEWIFANCRRIFAILVSLKDQEYLIEKFMEKDIQGAGFDHRLPFTKEFLASVLVDPEIATAFYNKQWEYTSPIWSRNIIHRDLPPETRLPFTCNRLLGSGGNFGDIYVIKVHEDHQPVVLLPGAENQRMVRKEFKSAISKEECIKELKNLNILNELKHPNIVEVITSYTYCGKHNLLFPYIEGGDLGSILQKDRDTLEFFQRNESFLVAICELSSAIERVHHYMHERFDIKLMGCHHDLKPKNILIRGSTFVLADFGLSKLKDSNESSEDKYEGSASDYFAPECKTSGMSQATDIWSFGSILSEILTYMHLGPTGVKDFKRKRSVKIGNRRISAFHQGIGQVNQGFQDWLSALPTESDKFTREVVDLIRRMTDLDPAARPNAKQVRFNLQRISVQAHYALVKSLYKALVARMEGSFEAYSEYMRIKSWGSVLGLLRGNAGIEASALTEKMKLVDIYNCLRNIRDQLESTIEQCQNALSPLFTSLHSLGDELFDLLPPELDVKAKDHWEIEMVRSEDLEDLLKTAEAAVSVNNRISMLARIKHMSILAAERGKAPLNPKNLSLKIPYKCVKTVAPLETHTYAELRREGEALTSNVLIEWIRYGAHETGFYSGLLGRIESLAALLNSSTNAPDFRILHCVGFVSHDAEGAYGLVFDLPRRSVSEPRSLARVIADTHNFRDRPTLGSRFNLALTLALSLSGVHKVGWLHKSISAHNILLLIPLLEAKSANASAWLDNPHLIGFNHSRQDDALAFTLGPDDNEKALQYYHPEYARKTIPQIPYRLQYDYYSLGLVLLEIGLWERLPSLALIQGKKPSSNSAMLEHLLKRRVGKLGHTMGVDYQAAVWACLQSFEKSRDPNSVPQDNTTLQLRFEELVVQRLRRCCA